MSDSLLYGVGINGDRIFITKYDSSMMVIFDRPPAKPAAK